MEFSVLNKQTVQCVMTEAEVADYGMDKKAIYQNDDRVRDFFRRIMRKAEQETGFRKEQGSISVHAAFLSDESLEITFFVNSENILQEDVCNAFVIFKSKRLPDMMEFCARAPEDLTSWLYKYKRVYFILADIRNYEMHQIAALFNLADEYMDGICYTKGITAFIREHGTCMVAENAVQVLGQL